MFGEKEEKEEEKKEEEEDIMTSKNLTNLTWQVGKNHINHNIPNLIYLIDEIQENSAILYQLISLIPILIQDSILYPNLCKYSYNFIYN